MKLEYDLPAAPGSYVLYLRPSQRLELGVGRLGRLSFPAGEYLYLGSAGGPGGLRARLGRHIRGGGKPHWHIDPLRAAADLGGCFYLTTGTSNAHQPLECLWSQALAALPGATLPAPGFGAGDCRRGCRAHLVAFPWLGDSLPYENRFILNLAEVLSRSAGVAFENLVFLGQSSTSR